MKVLGVELTSEGVQGTVPVAVLDKSGIESGQMCPFHHALQACPSNLNFQSTTHTHPKSSLELGEWGVGPASRVGLMPRQS